MDNALLFLRLPRKGRKNRLKCKCNSRFAAYYTNSSARIE